MAKRINLQGGDMRQSILDAARALFVEKGVNNTSLKDIARAVQISPGTLFYYYSSKSDLIFDVTDQHFDRLTQQLLDWVCQARDQTEPRQAFEFVFEKIVGDQVRGKLHHYLIEEALSSDSSVRTRFLQKYQEWRRMIETGISSFMDEGDHRQVTAQIILATLDGLVIQSMLGVEDIPLDQIAGRFASLLSV
jgi:AcrR family transcriptional regulator